MKTIFVKSICWFLLVAFMSGCTTTEVIQYKAELNNPDKTGTLTVYTKDSTEYVLDNYSLKDSIIIGSGYVNLNDGSSRRYEGKIKVSDVVKIEGEKVSIERTLLGLGVLGVFLAAYLTYASVDDSGTKVKVTYVGPSGGGCK